MHWFYRTLTHFAEATEMHLVYIIKTILQNLKEISVKDTKRVPRSACTKRWNSLLSSGARSQPPLLPWPATHQLSVHTPSHRHRSVRAMQPPSSPQMVRLKRVKHGIGIHKQVFFKILLRTTNLSTK
jgi:hypothetical protein